MKLYFEKALCERCSHRHCGEVLQRLCADA